MLAVTNF